MADSENVLFFSVASLWEITIKSGLNRADFRVDARWLRCGLIDNGYHELAILSTHVVALDVLPPLHKDPFDRLLIAQAVEDTSCSLMTPSSRSITTAYDLSRTIDRVSFTETPRPLLALRVPALGGGCRLRHLPPFTDR